MYSQNIDLYYLKIYTFLSFRQMFYFSISLAVLKIFFNNTFIQQLQKLFDDNLKNFCIPHKKYIIRDLETISNFCGTDLKINYE